MSLPGIIYDLAGKEIIEEGEKLNPFDSVVKKTAEAGNKIVEDTLHHIPGFKQLIDGKNALVTKTGEGVDLLKEKSGLNDLDKLMDKHIKGGKEALKDKLGITDNTTYSEGARKTLENNKYYPTEAEKLLNKETLDKQLEMQHISDHMKLLDEEGFFKGDEGRARKQKIIEDASDYMNNKISKEGLHKLEFDQEKAFHDNILGQNKIGASDSDITTKPGEEGDDYRVKKWNTRGNLIKPDETLAIRERLKRVIRKSDMEFRKKKKVMDWLNRSTAGGDGTIAINSRGNLAFVGKDNVISSNKSLLESFRKTVIDSGEFTPDMNDNLFGKSDRLFETSGAMNRRTFMNPKKGIKGFDIARKNRQDIADMMSKDVLNDKIDIGGRELANKDKYFNYEGVTDPVDFKNPTNQTEIINPPAITLEYNDLIKLTDDEYIEQEIGQNAEDLILKKKSNLPLNDIEKQSMENINNSLYQKNKLIANNNGMKLPNKVKNEVGSSEPKWLNDNFDSIMTDEEGNKVPAINKLTKEPFPKLSTQKFLAKKPEDLLPGERRVQELIKEKLEVRTKYKNSPKGQLQLGRAKTVSDSVAAKKEQIAKQAQEEIQEQIQGDIQKQGQEQIQGQELIEDPSKEFLTLGDNLNTLKIEEEEAKAAGDTKSIIKVQERIADIEKKIKSEKRIATEEARKRVFATEEEKKAEPLIKPKEESKSSDKGKEKELDTPFQLKTTRPFQLKTPKPLAKTPQEIQDIIETLSSEDSKFAVSAEEYMNDKVPKEMVEFIERVEKEGNKATLDDMNEVEQLKTDIKNLESARQIKLKKLGIDPNGEFPKTTTTTTIEPKPTIEPGELANKSSRPFEGTGRKITDPDETQESGIGKKIGTAVAGGLGVGALAGGAAVLAADTIKTNELSGSIEGLKGAIDKSKNLGGQLKEGFKQIGDLKNGINDTKDKIKDILDTISDDNKKQDKKDQAQDKREDEQEKAIIGQIKDLKNDINGLDTAHDEHEKAITIVNNPSTSVSQNNAARTEMGNKKMAISDLETSISNKYKRLSQNMNMYKNTQQRKLSRVEAIKRAEDAGDKRQAEAIRNRSVQSMKPINITISNNNKPDSSARIVNNNINDNSTITQRRGRNNRIIKDVIPKHDNSTITQRRGKYNRIIKDVLPKDDPRIIKF